MLIRSIMVAALMAAGQASAQEVWLSPGGLSWHQDRDAGYRERNPGVVLEIRQGDHAVMAGEYRNSFNRDSKLLGYRYTFARWGNWGAGGTICIVDNYPANEGRLVPCAAPSTFWERGPVNVTLFMIPPVSEKIGGGLIGATVSVRVW
jgi:hypothetical protein